MEYVQPRGKSLQNLLINSRWRRMMCQELWESQPTHNVSQCWTRSRWTSSIWKIQGRTFGKIPPCHQYKSTTWWTSLISCSIHKSRPANPICCSNHSQRKKKLSYWISLRPRFLVGWSGGWRITKRVYPIKSGWSLYEGDTSTKDLVQKCVIMAIQGCSYQWLSSHSRRTSSSEETH